MKVPVQAGIGIGKALQDRQRLLPEILLKTLLPNMLGPLVVNASTQLGTMMIGIAGLSFLGIGVPEPQAEWGSSFASLAKRMESGSI